uniref:Kinetochore protein NDC80 n=1 Tax=Monopterus albus TaxID=43700 RepID=A0A3Q3J9I7_MONAL
MFLSFLVSSGRSGRMSRATSSRLSELPLRVQDNNRMSMAYATPQNKQPLFGKLNIPKPQSVTSERRTSFFGARTSGASMPRNSIMSRFGGTEKIKDSRPLHDKSYVQQCIRQLHECVGIYCFFLPYKHAYPGTLSAKTLQSPSTKEFVKILEFIYRQIDPTFEMPSSKVEEEVPAILKSLRYPFVLSKCSMYSVGAPHTWPQALGALMWLIDNVKVRSRQHFLVGITEDHYYLKPDSFKLLKVDEALLASEEKKHSILSGEVERLEKESQTDRLITKRMEKMQLQTDLKKIQSYRSNLKSFKANQENKVSELNDELETNANLLECLKHEQGGLQHLLENQKLTPADVERINREKRELQQIISSLSKSLEDAERHKWNEEIALAKVKEKVLYVHKLARKLKLIPQSAENACGHDFEISSYDYGSGSMVQHKMPIQVVLRKLISDVEEENSRLVNMNLSAEEAYEQVFKSNILDKSNDLKQLKEQIRKVDERLDSNMQELAREEQEWAAEMESVDNYHELLEKKINLGYDEAVQQLKAAQQQYHLVLQETNEERRTVANNLASVFATAANHLTVTEKSQEDLYSKVQRVCSKAVADDAAAIQKMQETLESFRLKANSL